MYVNSVFTIQYYFDKRRSLATGIAASGIGVGVIFFGVILNFLVSKFGLQSTLQIQALITLLGVLCGALFSNIADENIEECSNIIEDEQKSYGSEKEQNSMKEDDSSNVLEKWFPLELRLNPIIYLMTFAMFTFMFGYFVPYHYIPERALQLGYTASEAAFLITISGIATVANRLTGGLLGNDIM